MALETGGLDSWDSAALAKALANLGYPGFRQLRDGSRCDPALILLAAISREELEVRIVEGMAWLAVTYHELNWDWLIPEASSRDLQNRLGFIVTLGRRLAEGQRAKAAKARLRRVEAILDKVRLAREDTLCQRSLSEAERRWLRERRPADARHWNLLTDLSAENLPYGP